MQGVYVLDGVGDDLDFPGGAPSAHVLIVSHPREDGACTVLEFDNGQFFDTPQCVRYDCRAKDGYTLRSSSRDAEFAFERVNGDAGCGLHVEFAAKADRWGTYELTWCGVRLHRVDCSLPFRYEIHIE